MPKLTTNPFSGCFIALEGGDGSGKTTQTLLLAEALQKEDYPILHTFEPTKDLRFGKLVRSIYTSANLPTELPTSLVQFFADEGYYVFRRHTEKSQKKYLDLFEKIAHDLSLGNYGELPHFIQLCMTFDRMDHRAYIEVPALNEGTHVISDRDFFSTLAYGMSEGIPFQTLLDMQKYILGVYAILPDLIIFLDTPIEIAAKRMAESRKNKERFDDQLAAIYHAYREIIFNPQLYSLSTVVSIDGSMSPDTIHHFIMKAVKNILQYGNKD
ncbi:MAG: hypothetical protein HYT37_03575 [Candidatus Sungbacteria bacterium]|nr:hypothetical protein [Candidatus Sungbacteria bacterium]